MTEKLQEWQGRCTRGQSRSSAFIPSNRLAWNCPEKSTRHSKQALRHTAWCSSDPRRIFLASRNHPSRRFISSKQCPAPPGMESYNRMHDSPVDRFRSAHSRLKNCSAFRATHPLKIYPHNFCRRNREPTRRTSRVQGSENFREIDLGLLQRRQVSMANIKRR
jgi:hypothetical protein